MSPEPVKPGKSRNLTDPPFHPWRVCSEVRATVLSGASFLLSKCARTRLLKRLAETRLWAAAGRNRERQVLSRRTSAELAVAPKEAHGAPRRISCLGSSPAWAQGTRRRRRRRRQEPVLPPAQKQGHISKAAAATAAAARTRVPPLLRPSPRTYLRQPLPSRRARPSRRAKAAD